MADEEITLPRGVKDVPAELFIKAYAQHLKQNDKIQLPSWVDLIKTAKFKELAPYDPDWYYVRAAALARKLYLHQGIGVGKFRKLYGGRNHRAGKVSPEHHEKAAGGLIRHILQQLETIGVVEKSEGVRGGRNITAEGQRDLDLIANSLEYKPTLLF